MDSERDVVIKGDIESGSNHKIYLIDAAKKDIIKDSTTIADGHFRFTYKSDQFSGPFEAMLCLWDEYNGIKYLRPIGFRNPYKKNSYESIFYVDRGITIINGEKKVNNFYSYEINGSKQNEPYYEHFEFDDLDNTKSVIERKKTISDDLTLIKKYPFSFHLLNSLYRNRAKYSSDEIKQLMDGFDDEAKSLKPYSKLNAWLVYKQQPKDYLPELVLESESGAKENFYDNAAEINMLVFWASWCGPCRNEIPNLKEIYLKYHSKGLTITSISIDNNEKSWRNALAIEKMPWKQLITTDSTKNKFDLAYDISAIPVIVVIDKNKKVLHRFLGVTSKEECYKVLSVLDRK
jgi:thiol-disulfide isomerase/thioredoxin